MTKMLFSKSKIKDDADSSLTSRISQPGTSLTGADILVLSPTPTVPVDQGNRKRIYAVCRELQQRGARIHFVHYPHEWWFNYVPMDLARQMAEQWDSFHLLPTTRPLHTAAAGQDHTIDEWWDHAIGDYLQWLFKRSHFDAFIVNYAYLSKAFEYAPKSTLKILDTHDKFTGRRQLFESNGVPREFFYTTQDQETIALNRANLVWAIKDEEAEFFRGISATECFTMPHVEPECRVLRQRSAADDGYLVIGMIGTMNSVNIYNARAFVTEVLPYFKQHLAPIKIRFAGGMCLALTDLAELPGIDLMGRVETVDEFYASVDLVTVPLSFSTGLKIKAVEAFATGMPIVAIGHALEGIPSDHPWHHCNTMKDVADACIKLAYQPELLESLTFATLDTYNKVKLQAVIA
ncbi:MAG: glycosyltransferase, partial [Methylophilaceae bacterium]